MAKYPTAALQAASKKPLPPIPKGMSGPTISKDVGFPTVDPWKPRTGPMQGSKILGNATGSAGDGPLTKAQAMAGAKATGGTASQDFKNNGEWVYGPKPKNAPAGSPIVNNSIRNWMTNGNASRGPRI